MNQKLNEINDHLDQKLNENNDRIDQKLNEINDRVDQKLDEINDRVDQKLKENNDRFDRIDRRFVELSQKSDTIYEYLSSDRIINAIQRKFFVEILEPLCSRTYSACASKEMRRLFAAFGLKFQKEYEHLWSETYLRSIRPCYRSDCIQIDLFGFAHLRTNRSIPYVSSPNLDPVD